MSTEITDLVNDLNKVLQTEVRTDMGTRILYSTDASIYQIPPYGVAFPRHVDEISAILEYSARYGVPVLARGAGSSLAGQAIGRALIIDCSRYLDRIIEIDPEKKIAIVEPGVVLASLNRAASGCGLQFGPDPASGERATVGGSLANNATGAHSIQYGMAADHLLHVDVALFDGSVADFKSVTLEAAKFKAQLKSREGAIYQSALSIRGNYSDSIRENWPAVWRRASGYNLNYLLPFSSSQPPAWQQPDWCKVDCYPPVIPDTINLSHLIAGSEGTLAVIRKATMGLVSIPKRKILAVMGFDSIAHACDIVPEILEKKPSAIELIPWSLVDLARRVPAYAKQLGIINELRIAINNEPVAILAVEFSGEQITPLLAQVKQLEAISTIIVAESDEAQQQVWGVRKAGLGILMSKIGDEKPWAFIEDLVVPVGRLGSFVRELESIFAEHATSGEMYAHASAGCLHIRPVVNLKSREGLEKLRTIATQAVSLALRMGGAPSGEHGDGLARSEWLQETFGDQISHAFQILKKSADPDNLLNPGKIASPQGNNVQSKLDQNLRFGVAYKSSTWHPLFSYQRAVVSPNDLADPTGLALAIEHCNGAAVCRKLDTGMCPTFQVTREEMHSTRGRANLLRAMISGYEPEHLDSRNRENSLEDLVFESLELCLACKACKAECPSAVDMAKLKYDFLDHYYQTHSRRLRDYLFGYIGPLSRIGYPFARIYNFAIKTRLAKMILDQLGIAANRSLPSFSSKSLAYPDNGWEKIQGKRSYEQVLFLSDAFTSYYYPEAGIAALEVLENAGCQVVPIPIIGSGRTLISKGFLKAARNHAIRLVDKIRSLDPEGELPIIGVEPSEIYTLCDEIPDLLPNDPWVSELSKRAFTIEEFLVRPRPHKNHAGDNGKLTTRIEHVMVELKKFRIANLANTKTEVVLHTHCYQKAKSQIFDGYPSGADASIGMLQAANYQVSVIDSGCCGMAGAFGYEKEHYEISMQVGEMALLPAIRQASGSAIIAASGVSCRSQIQDGTDREAIHPICLIAKLFNIENIG